MFTMNKCSKQQVTLQLTRCWGSFLFRYFNGGLKKLIKKKKHVENVKKLLIDNKYL